MENEMSTSINIMIELLVMSIVISFLMVFVSMGKDFENHIVQTVADSQAESYGTELVSASEYGPIPAASAFLILERNHTAIKSIQGSAYGVDITKSEDLTSLFDKKVKINIREVDEMYEVQIVPE